MADLEFKVKKGLIVANTNLVAANGKVGVNTASMSYSFQISSNDAILIPVGNTAERPANTAGLIRYNTDDAGFEGFADGAWGPIGGGSTYMKGNLGPVGDPAYANNLMRINSNTVSNNITISAGENALMVGPITIGTGNTLTIDTGGRVVIA